MLNNSANNNINKSNNATAREFFEASKKLVIIAPSPAKRDPAPVVAKDQTKPSNEPNVPSRPFLAPSPISTPVQSAQPQNIINAAQLQHQQQQYIIQQQMQQQIQAYQLQQLHQQQHQQHQKNTIYVNNISTASIQMPILNQQKNCPVQTSNGSNTFNNMSNAYFILPFFISTYI